MIRSLLLVAAMSITGQAFGMVHIKPEPAKKEKAEVDPRLLFIDGPISGSGLDPVRQALLDAITAGYKGTVNIVINSPGGVVVGGMRFITVMNAAKEAGITLDCYVLDMAASMAFQIFTQCDNRYALTNSFLLWHGVRVGGSNQPITAEVASALHTDLNHMNTLIRYQLTSALGRDLSDEEIESNFLAETLWAGVELQKVAPHFVTVMDSFPGLVGRLDQAIMSQQAFNPFGDAMPTRPVIMCDTPKLQYFPTYRSK